MQNPNQKPKPQATYGVSFDPVSEGIISESVMSHYVSPKTAISYAENMHNDMIGMMTSRRGFVATATSPAARAMSCVLYTPTAGTSSGVSSIVWQEGTTIKIQDVLGTASVTSYTGATGSAAKQRYDTIQGKLLITNGGAQPKYFDGTGAPSALGTSFPNTVDLISAGFSGRVWASDSAAYDNKVYYSNVISDITTVTGGASYLQINANSGDKITGFARTQSALFVFTNNNIFRIYNIQSQDSTPMSNVGCFSQEAIVKAKDGFYFFHPSGVFKLSEAAINANGVARPQELSIKIRNIIQRIPNANQSSVFGWSDDDHVYFSIGNLPSLSATNQYIIRYTISTQTWTVYAVSSASLVLTCAANMNFATTTVTSNDIYPTIFLFADDTVNFYKGTLGVNLPATADSAATTDFATFPVYCEYQTNWMIFDMEDHRKRVNGLLVPSENGAGMKVAYQIDNDKPNVWREIGVLKSDYLTLFNEFQSEPFNRIKFRVYGEPKGVAVRIGVPKIRILDDLGFETN